MLGWLVRGETVFDEKYPGLLAGLPSMQEFELRIGNAAELGIGLGRLGTVAEADQVNQPVAAINFVDQHLSKVAGFGAEDVLPDRLVTQAMENIRPELAGGMKLTRDGGKEDARFHGATWGASVSLIPGYRCTRPGTRTQPSSTKELTAEHAEIAENFGAISSQVSFSVVSVLSVVKEKDIQTLKKKLTTEHAERLLARRIEPPPPLALL